MYQLVRKPQDKVEIELVNTDGKVLVQRPISVQELLHQEDHTMHVGNGVSVRLEEYQQEHVGTSAQSKSYLPEPQLMPASHNSYDIHHNNNNDDSVSEHLSSTSESYFDESTDNMDAETNTTSKPRQRSHAAHHASDNQMEKFEEEELLEEEPQAKARQPAKRTSSSSRSTSSKSSQSSTSTDAHIQYANEISNTNNNDEEAFLRKEWNALALPARASLSKYNFTILRYMSTLTNTNAMAAYNNTNNTSASLLHSFRPLPLACHAMCSYVHKKDKCQRIVVYGGLTGSLSHLRISPEVYEFSLLTGHWKRIEGRQCVPFGHYGHTAICTKSNSRMLIFGGVGPSGIVPLSMEDAIKSDTRKAERASLLMLVETSPERTRTSNGSIDGTNKREGEVSGASLQGQTSLQRTSKQVISLPLSTMKTNNKLPEQKQKEQEKMMIASSLPIGFVPFMFEMNLRTRQWRALQTSHSFPRAFHSAVQCEDTIFIFGGISEHLEVCNEILAIHTHDYTTRLIQQPTNSDNKKKEKWPEPRYMHSAVQHGLFMIVHGGFDANNTPLHDTWAYHVIRQEWMELETESTPIPRAGHMACISGDHTQMVIYGGFTSSSLRECVESMVQTSQRGARPWRKHPSRVASLQHLEEEEEEEHNKSVMSNDAFTLRLCSTADAINGNIFKWSEPLRLRPAPNTSRLPPLACGQVAMCGDGNSFVLYGGFTLPFDSDNSSKENASSANLRGNNNYKNNNEKREIEKNKKIGQQLYHQRYEQMYSGMKRPSHSIGHHRPVALSAVHVSLFTQLNIVDEAVLCTFPPSQRAFTHSHAELAQEQQELEYQEQEEEFQQYLQQRREEQEENNQRLEAQFNTFVRRQQDFLKKKEAALQSVHERNMLQERERMEPALYLTNDEITKLIDRSEQCCHVLSEAYPINEIPSTLPDQPHRVKLMMEITSLMRQVRDVMKSMRASAPGITTGPTSTSVMEKKTHRRQTQTKHHNRNNSLVIREQREKTGRKLEDYSAAKPLRRVLLDHLLSQVANQFNELHTLNKALRNVEWEGKDAYLTAVHTMEHTVHSLQRTMVHITNGYVDKRVSTLVKGVDKHREVMRLLTEIVNKIRHDKIYNQDVFDKQRARVRRVWARAANPSASFPSGIQQEEKELYPQSTNPTLTSNANRYSTSIINTSTSVSKSGGGGGAGYFHDMNEAYITLTQEEQSALLLCARHVQTRASRLRKYCAQVLQSPNNFTENTNNVSTAAEIAVLPSSSPSPPTLIASNETGFLAVPVIPPPPLPIPPSSLMPSNFNVGDANPIQVTENTITSTSNQALSSLPVPLPHGDNGNIDNSNHQTGTATARETVIKRSNKLRERVVHMTDSVTSVITTFTSQINELQEEQSKKEKEVENKKTADTLEKTTYTADNVVTQASDPLQAIPTTSTTNNNITTNNNALALPVPVLAPLLPLPVNSEPSVQLNLNLPYTETPASTNIINPLDGKNAKKEQTTKEDDDHHDTTEQVTCTTTNNTKESANYSAQITHTKVETHLILPLVILQPLLVIKDAVAEMLHKVARIYRNDWDGNDASGAPQDVRVEKLCRKLLQSFTALTQIATSRFLSKAGAKVQEQQGSRNLNERQQSAKSKEHGHVKKKKQKERQNNRIGSTANNQWEDAIQKSRSRKMSQHSENRSASSSSSSSSSSEPINTSQTTEAQYNVHAVLENATDPTHEQTHKKHHKHHHHHHKHHKDDANNIFSSSSPRQVHLLDEFNNKYNNKVQEKLHNDQRQKEEETKEVEGHNKEQKEMEKEFTLRALHIPLSAQPIDKFVSLTQVSHGAQTSANLTESSSTPLKQHVEVLNDLTNDKEHKTIISPVGDVKRIRVAPHKRRHHTTRQIPLHMSNQPEYESADGVIALAHAPVVARATSNNDNTNINSSNKLQKDTKYIESQLSHHLEHQEQYQLERQHYNPQPSHITVAPGPFIVNAEYYMDRHDTVRTHIGNNNRYYGKETDEKHPSHHENDNHHEYHIDNYNDIDDDADNDYFYFSRSKPRTFSERKAHPASSWRPGQSPSLNSRRSNNNNNVIRISPAIGSVVGSTNVNATLRRHPSSRGKLSARVNEEQSMSTPHSWRSHSGHVRNNYKRRFDANSSKQRNKYV